MSSKSVKQLARDRIVQARRRAGYSQKEVASRLGMTKEEYREVERTEKELSPPQIEYLVRELRYREDYMNAYSIYWERMVTA